MKIQFIKDNYENLLKLLNCLKVGVYITDGNGTTLIVNDESCKTGGLTRSQVEGKNMWELKELGFVEDSVTLMALESGREESIIQNLGDGGRVFVTGVPFYRDEKIEAVISTERDITETLYLRELLKKQESDKEKYESEIEYLKSQNIKMWGNLVAEDEVSRAAAEKALRIAKMDTTILLIGESGTGKEVFANFIYQNSKRVGKPFIKVNCAAIPENLMESEFFGYEPGSFTGADKQGKIGLFEMASGGTIFLDEIAEIPVQMQSKFLRVFQEHEIRRVGGNQNIPLDVRYIVATNKNLHEEMEKGVFREDLYYRLNVMPIELAPLRERKKDIGLLAEYFVKNFSLEYKIRKTIEDSALTALEQYDWPGNIRELENVIERIIISYDEERITKEQVNRAVGVQKTEKDIIEQENMSYRELIELYEKELLQNLLDKFGKPARIARNMGMSKATLSRKLKYYQIGERKGKEERRY